VIEVTDRIFVGCSSDATCREHMFDVLLNVARDLQCVLGHDNGLEYAQVGLVDGPGNRPQAYCAAVLALADACRHKKTLVYDHNGSRAMAVAVMYLNAVSGRSWDDWIQIIGERVGRIPEVHEAHKKAFENMKWGHLLGLLR
jgi:hypothetical protein